MSLHPAYCSVSDLKDWLGISDSDDDAFLTIAAEAASRAIDDHCGRQFGLDTEPTERTYTAEWDAASGLWVVPIDDVMVVTGMSVDADLAGDLTFSSEVDSYRLWPFNAAENNRPYTKLWVNADSAAFPNRRMGRVKVTAQWGWLAVPEAVENAAFVQAVIIHKRRERGPDASDYSATSRYLDRDVQLLLKPYVRRWGCV